LIDPGKAYKAYWRTAIYQRKPGEVWGMRDDRGREVSLATWNKTEAVARARNTYVSIQMNGWHKTMAAVRAHGWIPGEMWRGQLTPKPNG
jgi:hypothetical protein